MHTVRLSTALVAFIIVHIALVPARADTPATQPAGKTFMWKATSGSNSVYLLGSVHMGDPSFYPLAVEIEQAFDAAERVVVEVDVTKVNQLRLMTLMATRGMYPPGQSLRDHVPAETMRKLEAYLAEHKIRLDPSRFRPWALQLALARLKLEQMGLVDDLGIDMHLLKTAHAAGKKVEELESAEAQIEMMASFDAVLEAAVLDETLDQLDEMEQVLTRVLEAWKAGDADRVHHELVESAAESPAMKKVYEKLFDERNVAMADKIDRYLQGDMPTFVIVGAGHLTGQKGIVQLLRDKGYAVEQVAASGERGARVPAAARTPVRTSAPAPEPSH